ncbi:unnamed protein product [Ilex paraguariensis]|uniref:Uncharacterized protein n=1 Tax=Ilex paraguariensis TaxID=185542 RepID=A0ABC8SGU9_9AQUA
MSAPNLFCHSRLEAIQSFDFLSYVNEASELSSDFAMAVAEYTGEIVMSAINNASGDLGVSLSQNFHPILLSNANRLVSTLLDRFEISVPSSPRELVSITPEASSPQCSPLSANHYQSNERNSPGMRSAMPLVLLAVTLQGLQMRRPVHCGRKDW